MTQKDLGAACDWGDDAQSRVSNYENGRREPTLSDLVLMAQACGTTLSELIEGVDNTNASKIADLLRELKPEQQALIVNSVQALVAAIKVGQ